MYIYIHLKIIQTQKLRYHKLQSIMTSSSESSASSGCEFGNEEMEEEGLPLLEEGDTKYVYIK